MTWNRTSTNTKEWNIVFRAVCKWINGNPAHGTWDRTIENLLYYCLSRTEELHENAAGMLLNWIILNEGCTGEGKKSGNLAINANLNSNKKQQRSFRWMQPLEWSNENISVMEFFILKRRTSSECSSSSKMKKRKIPIQMRKEQSFLSNDLWAIWMPPFAAFDLLLSLFLPFSSA